MLEYIIKSALLLAILYGGFALMLSRETFHRFNRMALVSLLLLSFVLPLVGSMFQGSASGPGLVALEGVIMMATMADDAEAAAIPTSHLLIGILMLVYLAGVVVFALRSLVSYVSLARQLQQGERQTLPDGTVLCLHDEPIAPFSWMHYIVANRSDIEESGPAILSHEMGHIRNRHTFDLILTEVALILQWFNPAIWLMRRELQAIHEYEADEAVLDYGIDAKSYQLLLIKKAAGSRLQSITNSLHQSSIKKRITMMLKKKSNPWARAKYLLAVPVAALSVAVLSTPQASALSKEISECKVSELFANSQIPSEKNASGDLISGEKVFIVSDLANDSYIAYRLDSQGNIGKRLSDQDIDKMYSQRGSLLVLVRRDTKSEHLKAFRDHCRANGWNKIAYMDSASSDDKAVEEIVVNDEDVVFFVDGKRVESILDIDPATIDHMEVLKSEEAMAKVGITDARGVILITTKSSGQTIHLKLDSVPSAKGEFQPSAEGEFHPAVIIVDPALPMVEDMPEYPGGMEAMMKFVAENLKYPEQMQKEKVEGRVLLSFVVEKDGSVTNIEEVQSPHPVLTEEAIRVVKLMPKWKPGKQEGKEVRVQFNLPITFRLN